MISPGSHAKHAQDLLGIPLRGGLIVGATICGDPEILPYVEFVKYLRSLHFDPEASLDTLEYFHGVDPGAGDKNIPLVDEVDTDATAQERTLASTVGADKTVDFSRLEFQRHAFDRRYASKTFHDSVRFQSSIQNRRRIAAHAVEKSRI